MLHTNRLPWLLLLASQPITGMMEEVRHEVFQVKLRSLRVHCCCTQQPQLTTPETFLLLRPGQQPALAPAPAPLPSTRPRQIQRRRPRDQGLPSPLPRPGPPCAPLRPQGRHHRHLCCLFCCLENSNSGLQLAGAAATASAGSSSIPPSPLPIVDAFLPLQRRLRDVCRCRPCCRH